MPSDSTAWRRSLPYLQKLKPLSENLHCPWSPECIPHRNKGKRFSFLCPFSGHKTLTPRSLQEISATLLSIIIITHIHCLSPLIFETYSGRTLLNHSNIHDLCFYEKSRRSATTKVSGYLLIMYLNRSQNAKNPKQDSPNILNRVAFSMNPLSTKFSGYLTPRAPGKRAYISPAD